MTTFGTVLLSILEGWQNCEKTFSQLSEKTSEEVEQFVTDYVKEHLNIRLIKIKKFHLGGFIQLRIHCKARNGLEWLSFDNQILKRFPELYPQFDVRTLI